MQKKTLFIHVSWSSLKMMMTFAAETQTITVRRVYKFKIALGLGGAMIFVGNRVAEDRVRWRRDWRGPMSSRGLLQADDDDDDDSLHYRIE